MPGFRRNGRKPVKCAVRLTHHELGEIEAEASDISDTGVFIRCKDFNQTVQVGDKLEARLFSDATHFSIAHLTVVRTTHEGVGLIFE